MLERLLNEGFWDPWKNWEGFPAAWKSNCDRTPQARAQTSTYPLVNVWTSPDKILLTAELPGFNPEDIEISVQEQSLSLKGKCTFEDLKEKESYLRRERPAGTFARSFTLPFSVDEEKVKANYKDGILQIVLERHEAHKPKKIHIHAE